MGLLVNCFRFAIPAEAIRGIEAFGTRDLKIYTTNLNPAARERAGAILGSLWGHFGVTLGHFGSLWHHFAYMYGLGGTEKGKS